MVRFLTVLAIVAVAAGSLVAPGRAAASDDKVRVVQRKPFLRGGRLELEPAVGTTINDSLIFHHVAGGTLQYHVSEYLAGGVSFYRSFGDESDLFTKVQNDYALVPRVTKTDYLVTAQASLAFLYGKFALFNTWVVHFDSSATVGLGAVQLPGSLGLVGDYGLGQRFFLTRWLTVNLGLRHYLFEDRTLTHEVIFTAGLGVFAPFDFEYETVK